MERFGDLDQDSPGAEGGWVSEEEFSPYEEEPDFNLQAEVNAYERTGMAGSSLLCGSDMTGNLGDLQKKINRMTQDPEQRFACYVDAISRSLMGQDVPLSQEDINNMINHIRNIKEVGRKNPTAYVLGYLASESGRGLDKRAFDNVVKNVLPHVDPKAGVAPPDIIRYGRLWETL